MDSPRIKVFTRSFDLKLYRYASGLLQELGYPLVRLTDQSADGYFLTMLRDTECDIAINVDEDAFVIDPGAIQALVQTVIDGGYANAGCPDGGEGLPRDGDPIVTNPFFNIFDLNRIRAQFDRRQLVRTPEDKEPYYPFFRWLAAHGETLYLPCERHRDGISTILKDPQGRPLLMHSWFARFYTLPSLIVHFAQKDVDRQKARIDALIREAYALRGLPLPEFGPKDRVAFATNLLVRWVIKVPQRISRWPRKLSNKIRRYFRARAR